MPGQDTKQQLDRRTIAHACPFVVFMLFVGLLDVLSSAGVLQTQDGPWHQSHPRQWLYPIQTIACVAALCFFWKHYTFHPHNGWVMAVLAGVVGITLWVAPGYLFTRLNLQEGWWHYLGFAPRDVGFNPGAVWASGTPQYWLIVVFRFLRMAVVVPLVEEVFWRGFLMRYVVDIDGDYWKVPFGMFHWHSLVAVTGLFVLIHSPVDYAGALIYGLLTYCVAVKTKSLSACVLMHAVANLVLGTYIMSTQQWGYW